MGSMVVPVSLRPPAYANADEQHGSQDWDAAPSLACQALPRGSPSEFMHLCAFPCGGA